MAKQALNAHERAVMQFFALAARTPITQAARTLRFQTHVIHYTLRRLRERGIIAGIAPYIDLARHGVAVVAVYFNVEVVPGVPERQLLERIKALPRLAWLARVGGRFQYAASVRCSAITDLLHFITELRRVTGGALRDETVLLRTGALLYGRRYLTRGETQGRTPNGKAGEGKQSLHTLGYGSLAIEASSTHTKRRHDKTKSLGTEDILLLRLLSADPEVDVAKAARACQLSQSTVNRRLRDLERQGTIAGYVLQMRAAALGMQSYRVWLQVHGNIENSVRPRLLAFCAQHPEVVQVEECVGEWQYELEVEVAHGQEIDMLRAKLLGTLGTLVRRIELVELFEHLTFRGVPEGIIPETGNN